jgi:hypothetical protein
MAGLCVFCRRDLAGIAAEEHIFPRWLLKHLGIPKTDEMFQGVGMTATLDTEDATDRPPRSPHLALRGGARLFNLQQRSTIVSTTTADHHKKSVAPDTTRRRVVAPVIS